MRCFTRDATDEPRGITVARRSLSASRMWDAWQEHLSQLTLAELQSSPTTSHHIQRLSLRLVESGLEETLLRDHADVQASIASFLPAPPQPGPAFHRAITKEVEELKSKAFLLYAASLVAEKIHLNVVPMPDRRFEFRLWTGQLAHWTKDTLSELKASGSDCALVWVTLDMQMYRLYHTIAEMLRGEDYGYTVYFSGVSTWALPAGNVMYLNKPATMRSVGEDVVPSHARASPARL